MATRFIISDFFLFQAFFLLRNNQKGLIDTADVVYDDSDFDLFITINKLA